MSRVQMVMKGDVRMRLNYEELEARCLLLPNNSILGTGQPFSETQNEFWITQQEVEISSGSMDPPRKLRPVPSSSPLIPIPSKINLCYLCLRCRAAFGH